MTREFRRACLCICVLLGAVSVSRASTPLPKDPHNSYGKFDNGLSYIIRPHDNPPGRVAFYLHVKTGALNETDSQNGLAHFLEHMAFNGTKNFAPDTLIPYMNKLGMEFGADSNAHTNEHETVFKLFMPDTKEETIDKALTILSDFAGQMLLPMEEIDKERPVILEESRSRKSAGERLQKEWMKQVFAGTRIATHDVIGDEDQIKKFPRAEFEDYWNTWYRPENMTLIVVGEVDSQKMIAEAKKFFGGLKARAAERKRPGTGITPVEKKRAFVLTDPEQVMGTVELMTMKPRRPIITTFEQYRTDEIENIGTWIVSRRLREMVQKGTAAFRFAGVNVSDLENEVILAVGQAGGEPADWNKMLEQVITEVSRAIDFGFSDREMKLAREEMISRAERAVKTESTQNARSIINRLSAEVGEDQPMMSAEQRLELIKKVWSDVTAAEVHEAFVNNYKTKNFTYSLNMPAKKEGLKLPTPEDVLAAADAAWSRKPEKPAEEKSADSLLTSLPKPGQIVESETDKDLKVTTFKLSNGVICHHRYMDYKKDEVMVSIVLPGGSIEETADNHGVSDVAGLVLGSHATHRLDSTQIRDYMTGKNIRVGGSVGLDDMSISVTGSPKDLETGMQLAYAILTDGKIEESAFENWKKQALQMIERRKMDPGGQMADAMSEVFYGGDVRLSPLTEAQLAKLNVKKGQDWFDRLAAHSAIEATFVGDLSLEDAKKLAAQYLGSLPQRSGSFSDLDKLRTLKRGDGPYAKEVKFKSVTPKAMALAGYVGCDESNVKDRRLLNMVARIMSDRMVKRIREDEQLVYSIGCRNSPGRGIPGTGLISAGAPTDPEKAGKLADTILEMMRDFAAKGPTDEEVDVAKKQIANELEMQMKEPRFWLTQIGQSIYRHHPLAELKELPGVFDTFTAEQLKDAAQRYMKDGSSVRLEAIPEVSVDDKAPPEQKRGRGSRRGKPRDGKPVEN